CTVSTTTSSSVPVQSKATCPAPRPKLPRLPVARSVTDCWVPESVGSVRCDSSLAASSVVVVTSVVVYRPIKTCTANNTNNRKTVTPKSVPMRPVPPSSAVGGLHGLANAVAHLVVDGGDLPAYKMGRVI